MESAVHDLDRQIKQGETLTALLQKRLELLKSLRQVETEIAAVTTSAIVAPVAVEVEESSGSADLKKRGRKPKGELSLSNMILQLVSSAEDGLTMSQIAAKLFENGFKTESAEPARLISATLSSMKSKGLLVKNERNLFIVPV
jgi:hypothetical protein